jgi:hypothetical protein
MKSLRCLDKAIFRSRDNIGNLLRSYVGNDWHNHTQVPKKGRFHLSKYDTDTGNNIQIITWQPNISSNVYMEYPYHMKILYGSLIEFQYDKIGIYKSRSILKPKDISFCENYSYIRNHTTDICVSLHVYDTTHTNEINTPGFTFFVPP